MIKQSKYSVRKNIRITPAEAAWLSQQDTEEAETMRRLIDAEMERQKQNQK
jgi:hypothetical protein